MGSLLQSIYSSEVEDLVSSTFVYNKGFSGTIMANCDLFIGAGGTMTREAAVLGVPTISIYQDELLDVDRFLIRKGFMVHQPKPDSRFVISFIDSFEKRPPDKELLKKGREAYELIKNILLDGSIVLQDN